MLAEPLLMLIKMEKWFSLLGTAGRCSCSLIVVEFVSRFYFDRPCLPAIAITTDTSNLIAIGNDYRYENLFSKAKFYPV